MKYRAISADRAAMLLGDLRDGEELGPDHSEIRGDGAELPLATIQTLGGKLLKVKKGYPKTIGQRSREGGKFEREVCLIVHEALPRDDPHMLADPDFWTWLALEFRDIVDWRHGGNDQIAKPANFGIGDWRENLFYRLWLRAELGRTGAKKDPYDLAKRGDQDFWRSHVFRIDYGRCRTLVHALVRAQFDAKGKARWERDDIRAIAKRLTMANATLSFEALDDKAALELIEREASSI